MFKKQLPIIFIGLCVVIAALVLGWSVFVKTEVPVQIPVINDENENDVVDDNNNVENDDIPNDPDDDISEIDISDWKVYKNEEYRFEMKYPLNYVLKEVWTDYILLRKIENEKTEWSISITAEHDRLGTNDFELIFKEFVKKLALNSCPADGPNESIYCTEITEIKPFANENGISGYEIYMNEITENFLSDTMSNRVKGPIFAIDTSKQTNNMVRSIFFDFDDGRKFLSKQERQEVINQIFSTFKFINP